ncbi:DUF3181 family protein [Candidatus Synechococcus calcipolaris G9]|uniref:DUF3181 family protein n=1 Tax=Candidatus Synechococcus calcipolaris G9 TaxID=1497997 RepID=A0ABT6EVC0_9SYNE|nr:DUF3181 family protein [Candidatus Synechococcus calcipolaris]MDG2989757.1 DUF3181 family protein [Candidatus Synechococcus calcipolaris G9]
MSQESRVIEALGDVIGRNIYIDVARWHLYLAEAKLHIRLAEEFYPLAVDGPISRDQVDQVLASIRVPVGGNQRQLPLNELIPVAVQGDLVDLLEQFCQEL